MSDIQRLQQILSNAIEALNDFGCSIDEPLPQQPAIIQMPQQQYEQQRGRMAPPANLTPPENFEIGDIVTVKSGGFDMTVAEVPGNGMAGVVWTFPNYPVVYKDYLPLASLTFSVNNSNEDN